MKGEKINFVSYEEWWMIVLCLRDTDMTINEIALRFSRSRETIRSIKKVSGLRKGHRNSDEAQYRWCIK